VRKIKILFCAAFLCLTRVSLAAAAIAPDDFFKMIGDNDVSGVKLAILDGFNINGVYGYAKYDLTTPLLEAVPETGPEIKYGLKTPLLAAVQETRPEIANVLLESGADTELAAGGNVMPPLMLAVGFATARPSPKMTPQRKADAMKIVGMFLGHGADVNIADAYRNTPLIFAVTGADREASIVAAKKLLDAGADVNPVFENDGRGTLPLRYALEYVYSQWDAKHENRAALIKMLLDAGADPNGLSYGETPLHGAAQFGDAEITKMLLGAGADKTAKNDDGKTPFDIARERSNFKVMALLAVN